MADDMAGDCSLDGTCDDQSSPAGTPPSMEGVKLSNLTLLEETTLAIQQFSVVIGVALLVAVLFFLMLAVDKTLEWINEQWAKRFGKEDNKVNDPEDPAALVGSFKRYK